MGWNIIAEFSIQHIIYVLCQIIVIYLQSWTWRLSADMFLLPVIKSILIVDFPQTIRKAIQWVLNTVVHTTVWIKVCFSGVELPQISHILITSPGFLYFYLIVVEALCFRPAAIQFVLVREAGIEKQWQFHHSWANTSCDVTRRGLLRASWWPFDLYFLFSTVGLHVLKVNIFYHSCCNQSKVLPLLKSMLLYWLTVIVLVVLIFFFQSISIFSFVDFSFKAEPAG